MVDTSSLVIRVTDLKTHFFTQRIVGGKSSRPIRAVDGVSLGIMRGETLGVVGESGCGKTTLGRTMLRLIEPTSGRIEFWQDSQPVDITEAETAELARIRRQMNMVFQDPFSSLNGRMNVKTIIGEPLMIHKEARGRELTERVADLLRTVGLKPQHMDRFPHAFSGGQRQRIAVARALALKPRFIVCDEPTSALDVSIQSQILNLLVDLQDEFGLTYMFISHDLAVVRHVSHRIAVMYLGVVVEAAGSEELCASPRHPYTEALLSAVPVARVGREKRRIVLEGPMPNPADPPPGCRFSSRCPYVKDVCRQQEPRLAEVGKDHVVACHFTGQLTLAGIVP
jgi:oligopeptide/dipeptide ABC transporter ATP-binding protein